MLIRQAAQQDLAQLLNLYTHLHNNPLPMIDKKIEQLWSSILHDANHHVLLVEEESRIICSCVVIIIPNLTHQQRPYALIENVVTHPEQRRKGFATQLLAEARDLAQKNKCYKMMLMSSLQDDFTADFYRKAGFGSEDKVAFVQWL